MNELGHQAHPEPWPQLPDTGHILSSLPGDWFVSLTLPLSEAKVTAIRTWHRATGEAFHEQGTLPTELGEKLQVPPSLLCPLILYPSFQVCGR